MSLASLRRGRVVALALLLSLAAASSASASVRYVAIGDSYTRGVDVFAPRFFGAPLDVCGKRIGRVKFRWFDHPEWAYPALVADGLRVLPSLGEIELDRTLTCSGASTWDWWDSRAGAPRPVLRDVIERSDPDLVTVTLGSNDLLGPCRTEVWAHLLLGMTTPAGSLARDVEEMLLKCSERAAALASARANLAAMVRWLRAETSATIVLTTYPNTDGSRMQETRLISPLAEVIRAAGAGLPDVYVVDLRPSFRGHECTSSDPWITRYECMHPTRAGQRAIASAVLGIALPALV